MGNALINPYLVHEQPKRSCLFTLKKLTPKKKDSIYDTTLILNMKREKDMGTGLFTKGIITTENTSKHYTLTIS